MEAIVFSKDRAMQLDALLRSAERYLRPESITVIFRATDYDFQRAYMVCASEHRARFTPHRYLKGDVLTSIHTGLTCFLVDDDLFYRTVPAIDIDRFQTHSLRLKDGMPQKHFEYVHSLDGNIYHGEVIRRYIAEISFSNPNQLESRLQRFNDLFTLTHGEGYLVGVPHNRVSNTSHCATTGKHDAKDLNDCYLDGDRINLDAMDFSRVNNVHEDIDYAFTAS